VNGRRINVGKLVLEPDLLEHLLGIRGRIRIQDIAIRERWAVIDGRFRAPTLEILLEGPELPEVEEGLYPPEVLLVYENGDPEVIGKLQGVRVRK
jgi:hypothetical protein